jgi:hypothetical protein
MAERQDKKLRVGYTRMLLEEDELASRAGRNVGHRIAGGFSSGPQSDRAAAAQVRG